MTSFALKLIALFSMFCDHFGDAFIGSFSFFNLIGRMAFPIFAFQISEGYTHTKNLKKYFLRLGIFALISQIPFSLFLRKFVDPNSLSLNVFFTLLFGLLAIFLYDYVCKCFADSKNSKSENLRKLHIDKIFGIILVLLIGSLASLLDTDYGFWGVIVIFAFYLFKDDKLAMTISFITLCVIRYGLQILEYGYNIGYILLAIFTILPIAYINMYNGKQGKKIKYLLYVFYPVHLLLLYFIF